MLVFSHYKHSEFFGSRKDLDRVVFESLESTVVYRDTVKNSVDDYWTVLLRDVWLFKVEVLDVLVKRVLLSVSS